VISESVVDIESSKLNPDGSIEHRGEFLRPSGKLLGYVKALKSKIGSDELAWREHIRKLLVSDDNDLSAKWLTLLQQHVPEIRMGNVGTSMKNVNDPKVRDEWAKSNYRIMAFEMEGGGIATTANRFDKGYILIRGVSDTSDGTRNDDVLQPYASRVAAAFLAALFELIPGEHEPSELISEEPGKVSRKKGLFIDWGELRKEKDRILRGRTKELEELNQCITSKHCRVVAICGLSGMGKTSLAVEIVKRIEHHSIKHDFQYVIIRSLLNAPPLSDIVKGCVDIISNHTAEIPSGDKINWIKLTQQLQAKRCLIILDNFETVLGKGQATGRYVPGREDYGELLEQFAKILHKSCLLLTSQEKPGTVADMEVGNPSVHSLGLPPLDVGSARQMIELEKLQGTDSDWSELVEQRCGGNPMSLKIVSARIGDPYNYSIRSFLDSEPTMRGWNKILSDSFARLSEPEQEVVNWLVLEREPISAEKLRDNLLHAVSSADIIDALQVLKRRYLVESEGPSSEAPSPMFALQNPIMEFSTEALVAKACEEIKTGRPELLHTHCLLNAQSKEYVHQIQRRMILKPIHERLGASLSEHDIETKLHEILARARQDGALRSGYTASNVIALLSELNLSLQGWDFSNLTIRKAYLAELELHDVNFANSDFRGSVFADTFGSVTAVAFDHRGDKIIAGTFNGEIRVWQRNDGRPLLNLAAHNGTVFSVAVSPKGNIIASGGDDRIVKLWNSETGECVETLEGHTDPVRSIVFSRDGSLLASAAEDTSIRLWVLRTKESHTLRAGSARLKALAFSPDANVIASAGDDKTIRLWDLATKECVGVLEGHTGWVRTLAFHPDGKMLASGGDDGQVRIWDLETRRAKKIIQADANKVWSIAFSGDGAILGSGGNDGTIRLWNSDSGQLLKALQGHTSWVRSMQFNPELNLLVSGSEDQTVRLWDPAKGQCLRMFRGYTERVFSVAYCPSTNSLVSGAGDHKVRIWRLNDGMCIGILKGHTDQVWSVALSPDEEMIASGSDDRTIRLWDSDSMQSVAVLEGHDSWVGAVTFSQDGKMVASGSDDHTIRLWRVSDGRLIKVLRGHEGRVSSLAFLSDGKTLVSGSEDETLRLWDIEKGKCKRVLRGHHGLVYSVASNRSSATIASGGSDRTIRLWDVKTHKSQILGKHEMAIWSVAFSQDGGILASGSDDWTISLWDVVSKKHLAALKGHTYKVWTVTFCHDKHILASGSEDGTIRIWDTDKKQCVRVLRADRLYARMNINGAIGLTDAQKSTLRSLGAQTSLTERATKPPSDELVAKSGVLGTPERIWDVKDIEELLMRKGFELGVGKRLGGYVFDVLGSKKIHKFPRQRREFVCRIINDEPTEESVDRIISFLDDTWTREHFQHAIILWKSQLSPEIRRYADQAHVMKRNYELHMFDSKEQLEKFDIY
jgi:WD40 repeat protein